MSRIGKQPISIPSGVQVSVDRNLIKIKGPKGELSRDIHPQIGLSVKDDKIMVDRPNNQKFYRAMHGLSRALINNMVLGVSKGFEKRLEITGVGYRAELKNKRLILQLGFSHPIVFIPPEGIDIACENNTNIIINGIDKELVGQVAAKIRAFRPPEPYKGKGVRYIDEYVRRKAGKTAA